MDKTKLPEGFKRVVRTLAEPSNTPQEHLSAAGLMPAGTAVADPDDFDSYGEPKPAPGSHNEQGDGWDEEPTENPEQDEAPAKPMKPGKAPQKPAQADKKRQADDLAEAIRRIAEGTTGTDEETAAKVEEHERRLNEHDSQLAEHAGRLKQLESQESKVIAFKVGAELKGKVSGARPELAEIVRRVAAGLPNVWLTGPAGSGKTTLARTLAEALGRPFGAQSFAPDMTTAALVGGPNAQGIFQESAFVAAYEGGFVYLLDECDAAPADILLTINAALANGELFLPRHHDPARRVIKRHPDTVIVCAANTWGVGADAQYIGRGPLDAAFLSRFALNKHLIGYDASLEAQLCPKSELRAGLQMVRQKVHEHKIRRVVGTREIEHAGRLHSAGFSGPEIMKALVVDWTAEEKAKAGINV